jgi:hypothetical protein
MANNKSTNIDKNLQLGIDAARTGDEKTARAHLIAVLKQDRNNIPAMLWLAFVLPSPEDTIRVLNRVLVLDPDNERARAGIRWARGRLGLDPDEESALTSKSGSETAQAVTDTGDVFSRQQLLSGKIQKQAKKGVLAHRARRTIRPLLVIILVTGVLGLASIGVGALALVPPETLAAWWPASVQNVPVDPVTVQDELDTSLAEQSALFPDRNLSVKSDTLTLAVPAQPQPEVTNLGSAVKLPENESASAANSPVQLSESPLTPIEPSSFLGPELAPTDPNLQVPVDNLLLAHRPAYPGEKWIEVNVTTQQVIAWEGDVPVFSFISSTGLPNTPTVTGEYHIYWKLENALMTGPGYYLPEVPYTMYFYGGYALHGTYWHDNFGQPMSHGCVNLETGNAKKLFEWAEPVVPPGQTQVTATADNPGTLVVVHE